MSVDSISVKQSVAECFFVVKTVCNKSRIVKLIVLYLFDKGERFFKAMPGSVTALTRFSV